MLIGIYYLVSLPPYIGMIAFRISARPVLAGKTYLPWSINFSINFLNFLKVPYCLKSQLWPRF